MGYEHIGARAPLTAPRRGEALTGARFCLYIFTNFGGTKQPQVRQTVNRPLTERSVVALKLARYNLCA